MKRSTSLQISIPVVFENWNGLRRAECPLSMKFSDCVPTTANKVPFIWKDASADDVIARMRQLASYRFDIDENAQKIIDGYRGDLAADAALQAWKEEQ
jgi:hypothetical protein